MKTSKSLFWGRCCFILLLTCFVGVLQAQSFPELLPKEGTVIHRSCYTFGFSNEHKQAAWVMYELTAEEARGGYGRTDNFREDPMVLTGTATIAE